MIGKEEFTKLIGAFMEQAALLEKVLSFEDMLNQPEEHGIDEEQINNMKDIISFHNHLYDALAGKIEDALADIIINGENIQMEYIGFTIDLECDKESAVEVLDIIFKELFIFSLPALKCTSADRVTVFLNTLKNDFKSCK